MPTQDAFIIAVGADGSSFKALNSLVDEQQLITGQYPGYPEPQSSS